MTALIAGSTKLARGLVLALEHGDPDYVLLIERGSRVVIGGVDTEPTAEGLRRALGIHGVRSVINAIQPFDETLSARLAVACELSHVPLLRVVPKSFERLSGAAGWIWVTSFEQAALEAASRSGRLVVALEPVELSHRLGDLGGGSAVLHRRRLFEEPPIPVWAREPGRPVSRLVDAVQLLQDTRAALLVTSDSGDFRVRHLLDASRQTGTDVVIVKRPAPGGGAVDGTAAIQLAFDVMGALTWRNTVE